MEAGSPRLPRMAPLDLGSRRRAPGELSTARNELVQPSLDRKLRAAKRYAVRLSGLIGNDKSASFPDFQRPSVTQPHPTHLKPRSPQLLVGFYQSVAVLARRRK